MCLIRCGSRGALFQGDARLRVVRRALPRHVVQPAVQMEDVQFVLQDEVVDVLHWKQIKIVEVLLEDDSVQLALHHLRLWPIFKDTFQRFLDVHKLTEIPNLASSLQGVIFW